MNWPEFRILTLRNLAACLAISLATPSFAAQCDNSWRRAAERMRSNCNIGLASNEMCLVQRPVDVTARPQFVQRFSREGDEARIPEGLRSLTGRRLGGGRGFTFLKVVTQATDGGGNYTPLTQEVVLIAFGRTEMRQIRNLGPSEAPEPSPVCRGEMPSTAPANGGVVTNSAGGGGDQVSRMAPLEPIKLLGRTADGQRLLVKVNESSTGWALARDIVMFKQGACQDITDLTVYDQRQFDDVFLRVQNLARASSFQIESSPVDDAEERDCVLDGFPPSGLLIFNPSGTRLQLTVNDIELLMASSALVSEYRDTFSIVVLEGRVTARVLATGARVTARSGEVIQINRRSGRTRVDRTPRSNRAGPWCNQIYRLARAAYTSRNRLRVPVDRINFCRHMPGPGYVISPDMIDEAAIKPRGDDVVPPRPPVQTPPVENGPPVGAAPQPPQGKGLIGVLEGIQRANEPPPTPTQPVVK